MKGSKNKGRSLRTLKKGETPQLRRGERSRRDQHAGQLDRGGGGEGPPLLGMHAMGQLKLAARMITKEGDFHVVMGNQGKMGPRRVTGVNRG